MSRSAALTGLAALMALTGCFQVTSPDSCRLLCTQAVGCPNDMICLPQVGLTDGLCVSPGVTMCAPLLPDGGTDAGAPAMLVHRGNSFALPETIRSKLVLLLWPDNLPPVDTAVSTWYDESGLGNNATALYPTAPPHVFADGIKLDPNRYGAGLEVLDAPSLDLGSGDFAIIVVAGLKSGAQMVTLFSKADSARTNSRRLAIAYTPTVPPSGEPEGFLDDTQIVSSIETVQPSVAVYGLRRVGDHVELRLNGGVLQSADLPAGTSTTNSENVFLGTETLSTFTVDSIEAVLVVKGSTSATDLYNLESFLTFFNTPG